MNKLTFIVSIISFLFLVFNCIEQNKKSDTNKTLMKYIISSGGTPGGSGQTGTDSNQVARPIINSVSPQSGVVGDIVYISGENFSAVSGQNQVRFNNNNQAIVTAATKTSLTIYVPAGATTGKITVTVNGFLATSPNIFTVN